MKIDIKPQDKRPPETAEFTLHPDLIQRLKQYAQSLDGSDVSYVLTQILEQVLPPQKTAKKSKEGRARKPEQEAPKQAAA
jgi:DNA-binding protein Fis